MKSFTAGPNENGVRLSRFVEGVTKDMPRSMMYKAFRNKRIKVNSKKGVPEDRIKAGDLIELYINDEFFPPERGEFLECDQDDISEPEGDNDCGCRR